VEGSGQNKLHGLREKGRDKKEYTVGSKCGCMMWKHSGGYFSWYTHEASDVIIRAFKKGWWRKVFGSDIVYVKYYD
jgi:hypothetical protein